MTEVIKGSLSFLRKIIEENNPKSILILHGNKSYETSGAQNQIERQLVGYHYLTISGFYKYPEIEDVKKVICKINENDIDFIIAVGGGTVMDIAKASSLLSKEQGNLKDYVTGLINPLGKNIRRVLIPTTAGTGSEITPFSVVYMGKTKYSLAHPSMVPDYAILAPELTYNLNPRITAETGCDALAQAIEGLWSVNATGESMQYSKQAIPLLLNNIQDAVINPSQASREAMLFGAHLAGKSIAIAKTTAAHALSYPLTAYHGIAHGHAVMLTLPYFFPINENMTSENIQEGLTLKTSKKIYAELLSLLKVKSGIEAKNKLCKLMDDINLERKLLNLNIRQSDLKNIITHGFNPGRVKNNPVKITEDIERDILLSIL